ncbi:MAG: DNA polymerase III subunit alpha [Pseudomonadota bacterium]
MTESPFIHLRVHSAYSLLEGALPIATLVDLAKADAMPALAITDTNNLFGALEFSEKLSGAGIQPLTGCSLQMLVEPKRDGPRPPGGHPPERAGQIALIAKDATGYANLMALTSAAFLGEGRADNPGISFDDLTAHAEGLIALTGGPDGIIDRLLANGQGDAADHRLDALVPLFGDRLYVELQRHGRAQEREVEPQLLQRAYDRGLPIVATNDCYFPSREDYEAHDALICIAEGRYVSEDDRRRLTPEHHFKTQAEMIALFADLPEAIENTAIIAQRCAHRPKTHPPILPQFVQTGSDDPEAMLAAEAAEMRRQSEEGLEARLAKHGCAEGKTEQDYRDRLAFELDIIVKMKFPGYFLIVADFIKWAKDAGIPVGPGRGSGAGSVVAWALTITDLDPLEFGLIFERFLNPERISMPDFDIDFCQDRRDEVIRYVQEKYGRDYVGQIITFGKLQARAVLRDVGRVLHMPYGQVDGLCKMVPNNPANPVTLPEAIEEEPRLQEAADGDEQVAKLLEIGQKLEGLYRHASTHAAGVVIGDRPLTQLVPLYQDPRSDLPATQFNMKWVEPAGLVKFDFLGLKTLTVIQKALQFVHESGVALDFAEVGLADEKTYEMLARAETVGVFQLESTGMRDALRRLKPDRFEDIIAMVSLYRPGPMDNIPTYIARKHGEEEVDCLHPMLEEVLAETYGVIIYQEQVQKIAQVMAGYTLGRADVLRRAMGKKDKAVMAQQKAEFVEGAVANGVKKNSAAYIFELVDKFAGYGFNKSHAAAYALLAYQTAYLKANHPVEFLAASMTLDLGNTDKLNVFAQEARRSGIEILPPCVNASFVDFTPEDGAIRYSMAALKSLGRGAVEQIVAERTGSGKFSALGDFATRLDPRAMNKRGLEVLAASGALESLMPDRAVVHGNADVIMGAAQRTAADKQSGQSSLFGEASEEAPLDLRAVKTWRTDERLTKEFEAIGFYLSGHPLDDYADVYEKLSIANWRDFEAEIAEGASATGTLAATVSYVNERRSQRGNAFAFVGFSDPTGQYEAIIFSEMLTAARELLASGAPLLIRVEAKREDDVVKVNAQGIESLDRAAGNAHSSVVIRVNGLTKFQDLAELLDKRGRCEVTFEVCLPEKRRIVTVKPTGKFDLATRTLADIKAAPGVLGVELRQ